MCDWSKICVFNKNKYTIIKFFKIIKDLKIKNMTLIKKSPKKVIGLEGYGIKIIKQELI